MVPSLKFTLVAWVAIIGFGSVSFLLKDKKDAARIRPSNNAKGFAVIEPFTSEGCLGCPPVDKLITGAKQKSKNPPVCILTDRVDYWDRLDWNNLFSSAAYTQMRDQYAGLLFTQSSSHHRAFVGSKERNWATGSK